MAAGPLRGSKSLQGQWEAPFTVADVSSVLCVCSGAGWLESNYFFGDCSLCCVIMLTCLLLSSLTLPHVEIKLLGERMDVKFPDQVCLVAAVSSNNYAFVPDFENVSLRDFQTFGSLFKLWYSTSNWAAIRWKIPGISVHGCKSAVQYSCSKTSRGGKATCIYFCPGNPRQGW